MSDLVERLRNPNYAKSQTFAEAYMREAADEIERLRKAQSYCDWLKGFFSDIRGRDELTAGEANTIRNVLNALDAEQLTAVTSSQGIEP